MNLILSEEFVEMDDLTVRKSLRRKGIGSHMQQFVMDSFPEHMVILVADGRGHTERDVSAPALSVFRI
ncbi:hypothetical protein SAMN04488072_108112 [Lentibacillus halodurans]|uniref:N-acetyltransferase domain-containing protein n=2 Tax=Lentibacillus halodurans TaxID=237679 RepID=A0A1I0YTE8_9BACI|nr:hypothetical protein SAMN04488072_108112 [Lentibacillus halodurans]